MIPRIMKEFIPWTKPRNKPQLYHHLRSKSPCEMIAVVGWYKLCGSIIWAQNYKPQSYRWFIIKTIMRDHHFPIFGELATSCPLESYFGNDSCSSTKHACLTGTSEMAINWEICFFFSVSLDGWFMMCFCDHHSMDCLWFIHSFITLKLLKLCW